MTYAVDPSLPTDWLERCRGGAGVPARRLLERAALRLLKRHGVPAIANEWVQALALHQCGVLQDDPFAASASIYAPLPLWACECVWSEIVSDLERSPLTHASMRLDSGSAELDALIALQELRIRPIEIGRAEGQPDWRVQSSRGELWVEVKSYRGPFSPSDRTFAALEGAKLLPSAEPIRGFQFAPPWLAPGNSTSTTNRIILALVEWAMAGSPNLWRDSKQNGLTIRWDGGADKRCSIAVECLGTAAPHILCRIEGSKPDHPWFWIIPGGQNRSWYEDSSPDTGWFAQSVTTNLTDDTRFSGKSQAQRFAELAEPTLFFFELHPPQEWFLSLDEPRVRREVCSGITAELSRVTKQPAVAVRFGLSHLPLEANDAARRLLQI